MRTLLTAIALLFTVSATAQKCHIGNSIDSVYSFYAKTIDAANIWKMPGDFYLKVTDAGSPPLTVVSANFDANLTCVEHTYFVSGDANLKKYTTALNNNAALRYNAETKEWVDVGGKFKWFWTHKYETQHFLTCTML